MDSYNLNVSTHTCAWHINGATLCQLNSNYSPFRVTRAFVCVNAACARSHRNDETAFVNFKWESGYLPLDAVLSFSFEIFHFRLFRCIRIFCRIPRNKKKPLRLHWSEHFATAHSAKYAYLVAEHQTLFSHSFHNTHRNRFARASAALAVSNRVDYIR